MVAAVQCALVRLQPEGRVAVAEPLSPGVTCVDNVAVRLEWALITARMS